MRFTRYTTPAALICTMLLAPIGASAAASKEMQELQRDVAMLSGQITDLQKAMAANIATLQTAIQENASKTNSNVNGLSASVVQSIQPALREMSQQVSSLTGLSVKVSNIAEDVSNLNGSVKDLQVSVNKLSQLMNDLGNQVKLLQAPAAAPPPTAADGSTPGAAVVAPQQPTAQTLFQNAQRDEDGAKYELAISGFQEFLRLYPNDTNAIRAQFHIGNSYYSNSDAENAVKAFDAVIERYPKDQTTTPSAYYMKGMALKKLKKNSAAIASFQAVVRDFPRSDDSAPATQQLRSMGATPAKKR